MDKKTIKCAKCKQELSKERFYENKGHRNQLGSWCKLCSKKSTIKCKNKNKVRWIKYHQKFNIQYNHKISFEEFEELVDEQEGQCAICGVELILGGHKNESTCVDHDHKTGAIRGILCRLCNRGIGLLKDDITILRSAANYIERGGK